MFNIQSAFSLTTCIAGKWQLNGLNRDNPGNQDVTRPNHFGFDEYCLWQLSRKRLCTQMGKEDSFKMGNGREI
jgi:arylsulfatase A